jgi:hypothetical protein
VKTQAIGTVACPTRKRVNSGKATRPASTLNGKNLSKVRPFQCSPQGGMGLAREVAVNQKNFSKLRCLKALVYCLGACFHPFFTQAINVEWDPNQEPNVIGYRVYIGTQSRVYATVMDVSNRTLLEYSAPAGTTFFAVTAYDSDNIESDFSEEVSYAAPRTNSPAAQPDYYLATNGFPLSITPASGVLVNDSDADSDPLFAVLVASVTNGTLSFNANGSFTYTPADGFTGIDSFIYFATDGSRTSAVSIVTITVAEAPNPQECATCFAAVDAVLTSRSNAFRPVIEARLGVSTNMTCPEYGVFVFNAVSRSARTMNDPQLNDALAAAAECLVANMKSHFTERLTIAAGLSPSRWTVAASNHVAATWKKLDRVLTLSKSLSQVPLLTASAASLSRVDRFIVAGDLAPVSLSNRTFACRIIDQRRASDLTIIFSDNLFVIQDGEGTPISTGQYSFSRTAWNRGSLSLMFDGAAFEFNAGETATVQIKFGRTRSQLIGPAFRGYFTLH